MEQKLAHLGMIQNVIDRMSGNSFTLKGWAVTLVSALLALSVAANEKLAMIMVSFVPLIVFWILDGFFLNQERLYRGLYIDVCKKKEEEIDFSMDTRPYAGGTRTWSKSIFSTTLNLFYGSLLGCMIVVIIFLLISASAK